MHAQTYREGEEIIKPCSEIPGKLKIKSISMKALDATKCTEIARMPCCQIYQHCAITCTITHFGPC